jgi:hypothetical protein
MPQKRDPSSETNPTNESLATDDRSRLADAVPIGRRGCLRLAGATLAGAAAIGATGTAAARELVNASDISGTYDVPSGEEVRILVGENEYGEYGDLENVLIDAEGADVQVKSFGDGWTIRNVGIQGPTENTNPLIDLKTDGGSGVIENVYLGDGGTDGQPGIFVHKDHSGTIEIRNCYVADFRDNGIYASTPGQSDGGGGATEIENCYGENNGRAHYRIGGEGSYVRDSIAYTDENTLTSRGVWVRRDDATVENTDITLTDSGSATSVVWATGGASVDYVDSDYRTTYPYGDFEGDVDTTDVGSDPSTEPPSGVPTSASEAAGGSSSSSSDDEEEEADDSEETAEESTSEDEDDQARGGEGEASDEANEATDDDTGESSSGSDYPNEVTVSSESGETVDYQFSVSEDVDDADGDDTVTDSVSDSSSNSYGFSGEFTQFEYSGPIEIEVNGSEVYSASDD